MMSTDESRKSSRAQIVKLDRAFKLAEQWVNSTCRSFSDDANESELVARPPRLGLGARVARETKVALSNDAVERKLQAKFNADKRKSLKNAEELEPTAGDEESSEDEFESRTKAFSKKRPVSLISPLQEKKKVK